MDYGLQLYSIRDITDKDMDGALKMVSGLGYKYVEFAGFFGIPAADIRAMLDKYGLTVSGTHTGWQEVAERFDETVAYHKAIGNANIIIPGADFSTREKLDAFVDMANEFQPRLAAEGLTFGYHNHAFEFDTQPCGKTIYEHLAERTSLLLEIDTYWAYVGRQDPVAMMEQLKDRLRVIHIKDGSPEGEGTPLGMGAAPVKAVYDKAIELGVLMVVESETLTPDGITEAKICMEYLKKLEYSR